MNKREWVFGSSPECDVWIPETTVSAQHCSLQRSAKGFVLRDLKSTNGTFVAGKRIDGPTSVLPESNIMLGGLIALPWPTTEGASRVVRIGRSSTNDFTVNVENVSSRHAEIIVGPTGTWVVADAGSTNGIGLKQGNQCHVIRSAALIGPSDTLMLGKLELPVRDIKPLFQSAPQQHAPAKLKPAELSPHAHARVRVQSPPSPPALPTGDASSDDATPATNRPPSELAEMPREARIGWFVAGGVAFLLVVALMLWMLIGAAMLSG